MFLLEVMKGRETRRPCRLPRVCCRWMSTLQTSKTNEGSTQPLTYRWSLTEKGDTRLSHPQTTNRSSSSNPRRPSSTLGKQRKCPSRKLERHSWRLRQFCQRRHWPSLSSRTRHTVPCWPAALTARTQTGPSKRYQPSSSHRQVRPSKTAGLQLCQKYSSLTLFWESWVSLQRNNQKLRG